MHLPDTDKIMTIVKTDLQYINYIFNAYCKNTQINTQMKLVGFVALRPKSTAMVIAGRSVHLTKRFPGQA